MPTSKSTSKSTSKPTPQSKDAVQLLTADHKEVKALFKDYEKLAKGTDVDEEKQQVALQICTMLTAHATVEEELFYPAAREVLRRDGSLLDEAEIEHAIAKDLIGQIEAAAPSDPLYDAKLKVLSEYIDHHVKEEEDEIFPKVKKSALDLKALGSEMAERKQALLREVGELEDQ
jgi:hemerythrin superfamily protein